MRIGFTLAGLFCLVMTLLLGQGIVPNLEDKEALATLTMAVMVLFWIAAFIGTFVFLGLALVLQYQKWCMHRYFPKEFSRRRNEKSSLAKGGAE